MIHDLGRHGPDQTPYIAMEYVAGTGLDNILQQHKRLSPPAALKVIFQLADALAHAHSAGIVHRDIKPANILVTANGAVKLVDFGIAHLLGSSLTVEGLMLGSPIYMSPEAAAAGQVDHRSDQFSLGTVFYECLTGQRPFRGDELVHILRSIIEVEAAPLSAHDINAPDLQSILDRLHAKRPSARYHDENELIEAMIASGCALGLSLRPALARVS